MKEKSKNYKLCILAAGRGTRNNSIAGLHKSLLPIENKAAISKIIEKFEKDVEIAKLVQESDDIVDNYHSEMYEIVQKAFKENSNDIEQLFSILSVSRYLERIADHCTNIAEDVEYLIEGRITRHNL